MASSPPTPIRSSITSIRWPRQLTGWRLEDAMGRNIDEVFRAFHEETCEPLENPLTGSIRRVRPIKSARPVLMIRRDGNELYVESTAAPIRDGARQGVRRRAGVPRRQREPRAEPQAVLPRQPRSADGPGQPPRIREPHRALPEERPGAGRLLRAVPPGHRPVQDDQRLLRPCRRRRAAGPDRRAAEVEDPLARHAVAPGRRRVRRAAGKLHAGRRAAHAEVLREAVQNFRFEWEDRVFKPRRQRRRGAHHRRQRGRGVDSLGRRGRLRRGQGSRAATACTASPRTTSS